MSEKPQGIYCCPGVRIVIEHDDCDQTVTYLQGTCPTCGAHWSITKENAPDEAAYYAENVKGAG